MKASAIAIVLCILGSPLSQIESLEKQALNLVQHTLASDLDPVLPSIALPRWFNQLVGPRAGIIWQLSDCGVAIPASGTAPNKIEIPDLPACMEANATLPDGHKVVTAIRIGTFNKGISDRAAFAFGVVEYDEQLQPAKRLSDLQKLLSDRKGPGEKPVILPTVKSDVMRFKFPFQSDPTYLLPITSDDLTASVGSSEQPLSPPLIRSSSETPPPPPPPSSGNRPQAIQKLVDEVLEGNAVTRVDPIYPATARMMKAFGIVKVQITISETGRVIEAKAISGHDALRTAAVEAAYKWVFKPTTIDGVPAKVQGVLSFNFKSSPK